MDDLESRVQIKRYNIKEYTFYCKMSTKICIKKKNKALTTKVKNRSLCAYIDLIWKIPEVDKYQPNQLHELPCFGKHAAILGVLIDIYVVTSCDEVQAYLIFLEKKAEKKSSL